jgi:hypothetical protein
MVAERGADPETLGLLGRVHKDRYTDLLESSPLAAEAALEAAIDAYERGFRADPRDYYPGVNAVTLLMVQGTAESYRKARELSPVVAFAVACRQGMASSDYWDVATVLELAVVNLDEAAARAALRRLLYLSGPPWRRDTTVANIRRLAGAHARRGITSDWIAEVVTELEKPRS